MRFLNFIGEYHKQGNGRCNHKFPLYFHTSHPQLCGALRHSKKWTQVSGGMAGGNKSQNAKSINRHGTKLNAIKSTGYGGHFRAVQGFKYIGDKT